MLEGLAISNSTANITHSFAYLRQSVPSCCQPLSVAKCVINIESDLNLGYEFKSLWHCLVKVEDFRVFLGGGGNVSMLCQRGLFVLCSVCPIIKM